MDPVTTEIMEAIAVLHAGAKPEARARLGDIWSRLPSQDVFNRCVLSHYMADAQDDAAEELRWDRRALDAAEAATEEDFTGRFPGMTLASFLPSLHLNLAASHERVGQTQLAREHAAKASIHVGALPDSDLARMTASAIDRIRERLADG